MKLYSLTLGLLLAALLGLFTVRPAAVENSHLAFEAAIEALEIARPLSLSAGCVGCPQCPGWGHELAATGKLMVYPGNPHFGDCVPDDCMAFHYFNYECGDDSLTGEEQEALWSAATGEDREAIVQVLSLYPRSIKLNVQHSSLQLYNCQGEIAASVPLDPSRLSLLKLAIVEHAGN